MGQAEQIGYDATGRQTRNELPDIATTYHAFVEATA